MKKLAALIVVVLLVLGGGIFLFLRSRNTTSQEKAVLKVVSTPAATVFLDNQNFGTTTAAIKEEVEPGEHTLKVVPESSSLVPWEGKITLSSNLLTYVNRELGSSEITSAGEVLTLEKISASDAGISVISSPDGATVTLAGEEKGQTPLVIENLEPGVYELSVSKTDFQARSLKVEATGGYQMVAAFDLAATNEPTPSPEASPEAEASATPKGTPKATPKTSATPKPSTAATPKASASATKASPPAKPYVEILDTPTGFLRVRKEATTSGEELAQIKPGEFYKLLDEQSGWYKIEYKSDEEGWISGQYAKKFE